MQTEAIIQTEAAISTSLFSGFAKTLDFFLKNNIVFTNNSVTLLLLLLVLLLKLCINMGKRKSKFLEEVISLPGEIIFIVLGYLSVLLIDKGNELDLVNWLARFIICLLLLIVLYFMEESLNYTIGKNIPDTPFSAKVSALLWTCIPIIGMYIASGVMYILIMYEGWFI